MNIWRKIIPCACSFLALGAGVGSILAVGSGNWLLGGQLILVSLILDGLDGTLARLLRGQSSFGAELDTFVDVTSFGIAPAVLLYFYPNGGLQAVPVWGVLLAVVYVMSGTARLARFRVVDPYRGQRGFLGLPSTTAAGIVAAFIIALESPAAAEIPLLSLRAGPLAVGFWAAVLAMLVLQVSHVRYSKPTKNPRILLPFMILIIMLFIPSVAPISALLMFAYGIWFAFISPFFFRRFLTKLPPLEELEPASQADGEGDES